MRKKTWKIMDKLKPWFLSNYHLLSWFFDLSCVPLVGDCRSAGLELQNLTAPRCIAVICYVHDEFNDVQTTSSTGTTPDERRQQYGRNFASKIYPNGYHNCRGKDGKKCRIKQWWCLLPSKQGEANTKPLLCFGSWSERTMRTTRSKAQNTGMTWNDKQ